MSLGKQELEDQIAKLTKDITTLQNAITDFEKNKNRTTRCDYGVCHK